MLDGEMDFEERRVDKVMSCVVREVFVLMELWLEMRVFGVIGFDGVVLQGMYGGMILMWDVMRSLKLVVLGFLVVG